MLVCAAADGGDIRLWLMAQRLVMEPAAADAHDARWLRASFWNVRQMMLMMLAAWLMMLRSNARQLMHVMLAGLRLAVEHVPACAHDARDALVFLACKWACRKQLVRLMLLMLAGWRHVMQHAAADAQDAREFG